VGGREGFYCLGELKILAMALVCDRAQMADPCRRPIGPTGYIQTYGLSRDSPGMTPYKISEKRPWPVR